MSTMNQASSVIAGGSDKAHQQGALLRITNDELGQLNDKAVAMGLPGVPQGGDGVYEAGFLDFIGKAASAIAPVAAFIPGVGPAIAAGASAIGGISSVLGGGDEQPAGEVGMQPAAPSISSASTDPSAPTTVDAPAEEPDWLDKLNDLDLGGIASVLGKSLNAYDNMSGNNDDLGRAAEDRRANNDYYQDQRNRLYAQAGRARPRQLPRPQGYAEGGPIDDPYYGRMFSQDARDAFSAKREAMAPLRQALSTTGWQGGDGFNPSAGLIDMDDGAYMLNPMYNPGYGDEPEPEPEAPPVEPPQATGPPELDVTGEYVRPTTLPYMPGDAPANAQSDYFLNGGSAQVAYDEAIAAGTPTPAQAGAMQLDMGRDPNTFQPLYPDVRNAGATWNPESLGTVGMSAPGGFMKAGDVQAMQQGYNPMNPQNALPTLPVALSPDIAQRPEPIQFAEGGLTPTPSPVTPLNAGVNLLQEGQMMAAMQPTQAGAMPGGAQNMMYPQAQMPQLNPQLAPQMNLGTQGMQPQGGEAPTMAADPAYQGSVMRPQGHVPRQGHEQMGGQGDEIMAMVSPGEYMLSADVVSALGNGDTATGEQHLNAMVDNIRKAKYGSTQQAGMINPGEYLPQFGNV